MSGVKVYDELFGCGKYSSPGMRGGKIRDANFRVATKGMTPVQIEEYIQKQQGVSDEDAKKNAEETVKARTDYQIANKKQLNARMQEALKEKQEKSDVYHEGLMNDLRADEAKQEKIREWNAEMKKRRESPMNAVVKGLSAIGDFFADNIAPLVGVPKGVTSFYKATRGGSKTRLKPENWITHDLKKRYFQVDDVDGWFSFPPVKWTDKGKVYYGLAHYSTEPDENSDYDSIAFHVDDLHSM